jgi:hypothetical protein
MWLARAQIEEHTKLHIYVVDENQFLRRENQILGPCNLLVFNPVKVGAMWHFLIQKLPMLVLGVSVIWGLSIVTDSRS